MHLSNYFLKNGKAIVSTMLRCCLLPIILCLSFTAQANINHEYAVFTLNQDFNKLTKSKVRMLYRGKIKYLQGEKIELSDLSPSNPVRNDFYQVLLGKDIAQMNAYWARLSFSGKARPPKEITPDSIKTLLDWASVKGSRIGYAPIGLLPANANILYIVRKEEKL